jgi:hypothetical protein
MDQQKDFFSENHKRLLSIATWGKYLAWAVLVLYILSAGGQIIQLTLLRDNGNFTGQASQSFLTMLRENPFNVFKSIINIATAFLRGFIYYVLLKGASLGLNMIVETDINYREQKKEAGAL